MQCGYRAVRCVVGGWLLAMLDSFFMQLFAAREKINERAFGVLRTGLFQGRKRRALVLHRRRGLQLHTGSDVRLSKAAGQGARCRAVAIRQGTPGS